METIEQIDEDFNGKKTKKKGLIIGGIVAVIIIVAILVAYFLTLGNPKFIFGKAIDELFAVDTQDYDSIKFDTEIKASIEAEDVTYQEYLEELEKLTIKMEAQIDVPEKKEIINLGLDYDKESVIDAQVYYNNGDMYTYFDGLFDKYIQIEMDEETKEQMDQILETALSEKQIDKNAKAVKIFKDELKAQINEYGKFEKKKDKIDIDKEEKVTKWTLTLTQKQMYNVLSKTFSNLAKNDKFIDCFEEDDIEDVLKEAAESIKDSDANSKNNLKISIYTKGLLNKVVAVDVAIYSDLEEMTIVASVVKEDDGVYEYKLYEKMSGEKTDLLNGKVEIEKDKESKEEQKGKIKLSAEIDELGTAGLEIDYSIEYNQGVDKINVKNSVNIDDITEEDLNGIMEKLMKRPLIGELISSQINGLNIPIEDNITNGSNIITPNTITTSQNEVKNEDFGYSVTYSVPEKFVYDSEYSYDDAKNYQLENADYSYIDARVSIDWYTEDEYVEDEINSSYEYWKNSADYKNVVLSDVKTITVGDKEFKYQTMSYESNYGYGSESKYQEVFVWHVLDDEYLFTLELEAADTEITEDIIKGFLNISVK